MKSIKETELTTSKEIKDPEQEKADQSKQSEENGPPEIKLNRL